ncbi:MAG: hypothetical protein ABUK01_01585 [Leptospirales bacterium]
MKKILLFITFLIFSSNLYSAEKETWPLFDYKIVPTKAYAWKKNYFFTRKQNLYTYATGEKGGVKKIFSYAGAPDLIRHFPYNDADAIVTYHKNTGVVELNVYNKKLAIVYHEEFIIRQNFIDFDMQFDKSQKPVFLFLSKENGNYLLDIKFEEKKFNILTSSDSIISFGLNWTNISAHFIYQTKGIYYWGVWKNGRYKHRPLSMAVKASLFIPSGETTYCYLIDSENTLWVLKETGEKYKTKKLLNEGNLQYTTHMVMLKHSGTTALYMLSENSSSVYWVELDNMERAKKLKSFSMPFAMKPYPGIDKKGYPWLILESSIGHLYSVDPTQQSLAITHFSWSIDEAEGYPEMVLQWQKTPQTELYQYRYILDENPNGKPLPDYTSVESEIVRLSSVKEGENVLHIQAKSETTGRESPVYHIPVVWKKPPAPDIVVKGEKADKTVSGNPIFIFIKNYGPYEYYLEINAIPVYTPEKLFQNSNGQGSIKHKFKPGKYYVHARSRSIQTGQFGPTIHYTIYLESLPMEQNIGMKEFKDDQAELEFILEKIEDNRGDQVEQLKWRKRLKELRERMEKDIKDSM